MVERGRRRGVRPRGRRRRAGRPRSACATAALERFGRIDVVVNNVGVLAMGAPEAAADRGVAAGPRPQPAERRPQQPRLPPPAARAGPRSRRQHRRRRPACSPTGSIGCPYVASKHAVVGISEALALYLGAEGHRRHLPVPLRRRSRTSSSRSPCTARRRRPGRPSTRSSSPTSSGELVADAVDCRHVPRRDRTGDPRRAAASGPPIPRPTCSG